MKSLYHERPPPLSSGVREDFGGFFAEIEVAAIAGSRQPLAFCTLIPSFTAPLRWRSVSRLTPLLHAERTRWWDFYPRAAREAQLW